MRPETVLAQIGRLACHFPNSGHDETTMKVVAKDWFTEFSQSADSSFVAAIDEVLRKAIFFPTIADIVKAYKVEERF